MIVDLPKLLAFIIVLWLVSIVFSEFVDSIAVGIFFGIIFGLAFVHRRQR